MQINQYVHSCPKCVNRIIFLIIYTNRKMCHSTFQTCFHNFRPQKWFQCCFYSNTLLPPNLSKMSRLQSISVCLILLALTTHAVVQQTVHVRGILLCGKTPISNMDVKLMDDDSGGFCENSGLNHGSLTHRH